MAAMKSLRSSASWAWASRGASGSPLEAEDCCAFDGEDGDFAGAAEEVCGRRADGCGSAKRANKARAARFRRMVLMICALCRWRDLILVRPRVSMLRPFAIVPLLAELR